MADAGMRATTAARVKAMAIALDLGLIALVMSWQLTSGATALRLLLGIALTLPLWAPLPGLWRAHRRTFAWTTLCVIPYFVIGITETVARPASRSWTGMCLALALALFVTLIAYLRLSRDQQVAAVPLRE